MQTAKLPQPDPIKNGERLKGEGMRQLLRKVVKSAAPGAHLWAMRRWGRGGRDYRATAALAARYQGRVLEGPFAGMAYVNEAVGSALYPKMIGCYEFELHPVIGAVLKRRHKLIVDVGCAEGYYAIGLALHVPESRVYAYDIDPQARMLCAKMADSNGVGSRVFVRGRCDHEELVAVLPADSALILCDCEGFELELLDPERVGALCRCDLLVELHDFIVPGLTPKLLQRFTNTHNVEIIPSIDRRPGDRPEFRRLSAADQIHALCERPTPMQWAWLTTKLCSTGSADSRCDRAGQDRAVI